MTFLTDTLTRLGDLSVPFATPVGAVRYAITTCWTLNANSPKCAAATSHSPPPWPVRSPTVPAANSATTASPSRTGNAPPRG